MRSTAHASDYVLFGCWVSSSVNNLPMLQDDQPLAYASHSSYLREQLGPPSQPPPDVAASVGSTPVGPAAQWWPSLTPAQHVQSVGGVREGACPMDVDPPLFGAFLPTDSAPQLDTPMPAARFTCGHIPASAPAAPFGGGGPAWAALGPQPLPGPCAPCTAAPLNAPAAHAPPTPPPAESPGAAQHAALPGPHAWAGRGAPRAVSPVPRSAAQAWAQLQSVTPLLPQALGAGANGLISASQSPPPQPPPSVLAKEREDAPVREALLAEIEALPWPVVLPYSSRLPGFPMPSTHAGAGLALASPLSQTQAQAPPTVRPSAPRPLMAAGCDHSGVPGSPGPDVELVDASSCGTASDAGLAWLSSAAGQTGTGTHSGFARFLRESVVCTGEVAGARTSASGCEAAAAKGAAPEPPPPQPPPHSAGGLDLQAPPPGDTPAAAAEGAVPLPLRWVAPAVTAGEGAGPAPAVWMSNGGSRSKRGEGSPHPPAPEPGFPARPAPAAQAQRTSTSPSPLNSGGGGCCDGTSGGDSSGCTARFGRASGGGSGGGGLSLSALQRVFDLPATEAVAVLRCSANDLKRRCRALGIARWPQRKLASLRRIAEAAEADGAMPEADRQAVLARVASNRAAILADPNAPLEPALLPLRQAQYKQDFDLRRRGSGAAVRGRRQEDEEEDD
ncbi:hypothetical protein HYH03_004300 [Edaphochlamys debaryana]|uniref:RWP-RK domain-containing protein n=1 Tax=Edaphochlamys debaryana TaxID=47281 RepID=A0A835Y7M0_9CHLO|nr:hypothetical protein HYH03_004300 [Edaphochlamys debaryana]|eukprot:KAG2497553.1 hypothetical protein HYH03_004300 [Edaphochlamys debaryana]